MADVPLSTVIGGGSGAGVTLAPDLNYISNNASQATPYQVITGIDGTSGPATALSLSGRFIVPLMAFNNMSDGDVDISLTVDGTQIINDSFTLSGGTADQIASIIGGIGSNTNQQGFASPEFLVQDSLLLTISHTVDVSIQLAFIARPIA